MQTPVKALKQKQTREVAALDAEGSERCGERESMRLPVYLKRASEATGTRSAAGRTQGVSAQGFGGASMALPHLARVQQAFGAYDVSAVRAHSGAAAAGACRELGASAYASGRHVAFAVEPNLHTAAHEAAHVVQQSLGVGSSETISEPGDPCEHHADAVADAVVSGRSAEPLFDLLRPTGFSTAPVVSVMRKSEPKQASAEYRYVPIQKGGTWDGTAIVEQLGAGKENARLAAAILKGPRSVMAVCLKLYRTIVACRDGKAAEVGTCPSPSAIEVAAKAVFDVYWNLQTGVRHGSHEGGGCTLTYADLDRLANHLSTFEAPTPAIPTPVVPDEPELQVSPPEFDSKEHVNKKQSEADYVGRLSKGTAAPYPGVTLSWNLVEDKHFTINVKFELRGKSASASAAETIRQSITNHWNMKIGDVSVKCEVSVLVPTPGTKAAADTAIIVLVDTPEFRSTINKAGPGYPQNRSIQLATSDVDSWTPAHEFGHYIGLDDQYKDVKDAEGHVTSVPNPGWEGEIMAGKGGVLKEGTIANLVKWWANWAPKVPKAP